MDIANVCMAAAEELSEEDQQLKSELDMLVERLTVCLVSAIGRQVLILLAGIRHNPLQSSS